MTPVQVDLNNLTFAASVMSLYPDRVEVEHSGLTVDYQSVDTTGLDDGLIRGAGSGAAEARFTGGPTSSGQSASAPHIIAYDMDLPLFGGGASSGVTVVSSRGAETFTVPRQETITFPSASWRTDGYSHETFTIDEADEDLYPLNDRAVPLWGAPARHLPSSTSGYTPVTVEFDPSVNILRPNGVTTPPSDFEPTGSITVTETAAYTELDVDALGGYVRREFGATGTDLPEWRPWLGVGASGHSDPAFNPDLAGKSKHSSGADVFGWESYRYLRVNITAPTTADLTLTVEGVQVSVSDPHTTGSDRPDNFSATETAYTKTYPFSVTSGANQIDLDLCFPEEGGPFYHGRIDAIRFDGWEIGDPWRITGIQLVSLQTKGAPDLGGEVSLKCGFGAPVQRGDYSAIGAAHNGTFPLGNLGDQTNKPDETGQTGGNLRYVYILTGAVSGLILDSHLSLEEFWSHLGELEGWTVTWAQGVADAANKDSFGNSLGNGIAQWTRELHEHFDAGTEYKPVCQPIVRKISVVRGVTIGLYTRHWVWGAVDALVVDDEDLPAAEGVELTFAGATNSTDTHSYLELMPIPTGTTV